MKTKKTILIIGMFLFISAFCTAQVEPFTRTYDIYPDWTGETLQAIEKTADGGYIIAYNQNEWFDKRTSILKLDKYGEVEWHTVLDEEEFPEAISYSVCVDDDNNYYLAGYFQKSYYPTLWVDQNGFIAKYDQYGDRIWAKSYGTIPYHEADSSYDAETINDLVLYDDNRLIVTGSENYCSNNQDIILGKPWTFCIDTAGNFIWEWSDCNDTINLWGQLYGVIKLNNGKIVTVGYQLRRRVEGDYDSPLDYLGFIATLDENGTLLNRKSWHFLKNISIFFDVKALSDNTFATVGYVADTSVYEQNDKHERVGLIVFDDDLNECYQYNVNVGGDGGYSKLAVDNDTNIFVIAATYPPYLIPETEKQTDMLLMKCNKEAELIWKYFIGTDSTKYSLAHLDIVADNDGGASLCSQHNLIQTKYENGSYLYKVNENGDGILPISEFPYPDDDEYIIYNNVQNELKDKVCIYPNPAKDELFIEIPDTLINSSFMMISITGQLVVNNILSQSQETIKISELKNGIYIIKIQKDNIVVLKKIVVNK
ncbi:MAG: T9SS type A sorting domain-containing protein [Bacteroidales bacterium]|nr:T9SS type A sorting domain-containing protein [Bacteroidales bacterium]